LFGRTITLKVKFSDFKQITRNFSFPHPVTDRDTIASTAKKLLQNINPVNKRIRLLGIGVSNFGHAPAKNIKHDETGQLLLFDTDEF
jgi:DNA polymerase-4